jgi:hypothetical protein
VKAEYKRDLQNNYLILEIPEEAEEDSYRIRMAEQNQIAGLLSFHSSRRDGVLQLHYEVTSLQPLESMFEKKAMQYEDIVAVLAGIGNTLEEMQRYLLNPAQLVFDPQYIFLKPERRDTKLCYIPGSQNDSSITMLAEFILKRLDHEDRQAVVIGYSLYQKALEENFSLQRTLKEILTSVKAEEACAKNRESFAERQMGKMPELRQDLSYQESCEIPELRQKLWRNEMPEMPEQHWNLRRNEMPEIPELRRNLRQREVSENAEYGISGWKNQMPVGGWQEEPEYEVTHKKRRKNRNSENKNERTKNNENRNRESADKGTITGKLFSIIHPAVLLTGLFGIAALEIIFYLGYLNLTQAGGIFFLLISVEMLINKFWQKVRDKKQQEETQWLQEADGEDELYQILREEMYEEPENGNPMEETRCLVPEESEDGLRLVCVYTSGASGGYPDIRIGQEPVYIGKVKGESDVLLDSPTVSRIHARLSCRDGICYVKDLNSKNGTFCNGERLRPQEEREIAEEDRIAFAEVEYRAIRR